MRTQKLALHTDCFGCTHEALYPGSAVSVLMSLVRRLLRRIETGDVSTAQDKSGDGYVVDFSGDCVLSMLSWRAKVISRAECGGVDGSESTTIAGISTIHINRRAPRSVVELTLLLHSPHPHLVSESQEPSPVRYHFQQGPDAI